MHEYDKEEQRVLDRARGGEDLRELNKQRDADARPDLLVQEAEDEFRAVTTAMLTALDSNTLEPEFVPGLSETQRFAIEALFMASKAQDLETDEFISGMERSQLLNQALMHLQPVLALGLRPDVPHGRELYQTLVDRVNELRTDVTQAILSEIMPGQKVEADRAEEADSDGNDDDDGSSGQAGAGEGSGDRTGAGADETRGLGGALRRMFRRGRERESGDGHDE